MRIRNHVHIFFYATLVWVGFFGAGLPSYYQQYSTHFMLFFDLVILGPIIWVFHHVLRKVKIERRFKVSLWFAFYFTVPLAVYDWLYCGLYLGYGMHFIFRFWYLSIYYIIPWLVLPTIVIVINRKKSPYSITEN